MHLLEKKVYVYIVGKFLGGRTEEQKDGAQLGDSAQGLSKNTTFGFFVEHFFFYKKKKMGPSPHAAALEHKKKVRGSESGRSEHHSPFRLSCPPSRPIPPASEHVLALQRGAGLPGQRRTIGPNAPAGIHSN